MPPSASLSQSPTIRIPKSSPTPGIFSITTALARSECPGTTDTTAPGDERTAKGLPRPTLPYKRFLASSVTSLGPPAPLTQNTIYPHIAAASNSSFPPSYLFDHSQAPHTAKSDSAMMYPTNFDAVDMRRIYSIGAGEGASDALSAPQSVPTMSHNSRATSHTAFEPEFGEKSVSGDETSPRSRLRETLSATGAGMIVV
ncbi:hypothetical protein AYL99_11731 [Fonsecaea erecta]|uniref:Uncharacterized protein n=1 Tax=Fonsecaea erecta TaxID=1367422 RepID=A0A178Z3Y1_9EURO|nr:hypothetical protein AYL99_11731 [Fonsecaea erecta]OAP54196.1 hypothetical protein AYL99_11731 [Fonsecaea erecta]